MLKIGSFLFATQSGLGVLAKSFYDAQIITHPMIVRHAHFPNHPEWYPPQTPQTPIRPFNFAFAKLFVEKLDILLAFETFYDWRIIPYCREHGVKTVLCPMYECHPRQMPYVPDFFLCPSVLDLEYFKDYPSTFLPIPVEGIPWRQRTKAEVFLHSAGHGGLKGRNGTGILLDAMKYVESPIKLILRSQRRLQWSVDDPRIDVRIGSPPRAEIFAEGDVFIHPHKWDGLSLPLQEARAAGMLVMGVDRVPDNTWLPVEPLIPVRGYNRTAISGAYQEFDEAIVDPKDVAAWMDGWYGADITEYSRAGQEWAAANSWDVLRPRYFEVLEGLLQ